MTASAGVGRRRQHLVHVNFTADNRDEVGEGAAGVDADQYGSRAPPFHDAFNNILKLSGFFAASKAAMPSSSAKVPSISKYVDQSCLRERVESRLKAAASRADHGDFVHHDRREIDFSRRSRGALQYDLSARTHEFHRAAKTGLTSAAIDRHVEFVPQRRLFRSLESELSEPREFFPMMSRDNRHIVLALERQRDNRTEPSVADDDNSLIARQMNLSKISYAAAKVRRRRRRRQESNRESESG